MISFGDAAAKVLAGLEVEDEEDCGYELNDPKHPTYMERMYDKADRMKKEERGE